MTTQQHTPTPYTAELNPLVGGAMQIRDVERHIIAFIPNRHTQGGTLAVAEENAAFIVRACNAYDALVGALEATLTYLGDEETDPSIEAAALRGDILNALAKVGRT